MNIQNLLGCLKKEFDLLLQLKNISVEKQKSLLTSNYENLEFCLKQEENILLSLQDEEQARVKIISKILDRKTSLSKQEMKTKLTVLLKNYTDSKNLLAMQKFEDEMKNILFTIRKLNEHNLFLINSSQQFLNEVMKVLISNPQRAIIDRRI